MRYFINFDRLVNQLVPYYLGGRRLILFLQSCVRPLQKINEDYVTWAKETRIEASMTSQIFKFEWFLNRKFSPYFLNKEERIVIKNGEKVGTPVFYQSAADIDESLQFRVFAQNEDGESSVLYFSTEKSEPAKYSFVVYCPPLWQDNTTGRLRNNMTQQEFFAMFKYWIERYKLAGKTYKIILNEGI